MAIFGSPSRSDSGMPSGKQSEAAPMTKLLSKTLIMARRKSRLAHFDAVLNSPPQCRVSRPSERSNTNRLIECHGSHRAIQTNNYIHPEKLERIGRVGVCPTLRPSLRVSLVFSRKSPEAVGGDRKPIRGLSTAKSPQRPDFSQK